MIDIGYTLETPIYGLTDDKPRRITYAEMKELPSIEFEAVMRCPAIQNYVKNTYLLPFHFHGSFKINGVSADGQISAEDNLTNAKNLNISPTGQDEYLVQTEGSSYFFFSDVPGVHMVAQPAPNAPIRTPMRSVLDIYKSPRAIHAAWFAKTQERFEFNKGDCGIMVTFTTPDDETVNLIPCYETDLSKYLTSLERDNRRFGMMSWSKMFNRQGRTRPQNQIKKFKIEEKGN